MVRKYIVATIKDWHLNEFSKRTLEKKGYILIDSREKLTLNLLREINPSYIFFPHWSWIVPQEIIDEFDCICFHSTDVPYGRGGSPIQNLIIRGHQTTKISALKMIKELDAGPVYLKRELSLVGRAQNIFENSAQIIFDMIELIVENNPIPQEQIGESTIFNRRTNDENQLPMTGDLELLYNHIRMLDAESYPKSFIEYGDYKLEFDHAKLEPEYLQATIRIRRKNS